MTRQNRVLPTGEIAAIDARGTLTGNRGVLHDGQGRLGKARWRHPRWISCELSYKGWTRQIMAPGRWTELFFLDEAVAMAAGHRPCALCRRADYAVFCDAWARAFGAREGASEMDRALHGARITPGTRVHVTYEDRLANLPDGTFIRVDGTSLLLSGGALLPFLPDGYGPGRLRQGDPVVTVLTPKPLVAVLAAGYRPRLHGSAL